MSLMKNYLIGTSLILGSLVTPSFAEEPKGFYLSIGGGSAFPSDVEANAPLNGEKRLKFPTDTSGLYSAGFGYDFSTLRLEFNYSNTTIQADSVTIKTAAGAAVSPSSSVPNFEQKINSYMGFAYLDFTNESKWTPYVGTGLGVATISTEDMKTSVVGAANTAGDEKAVFSYAFKAGIDYEIAKNTAIYTEATYQNFASYKAKESAKATVSYDSSDYFAVTAGLKFIF